MNFIMIGVLLREALDRLCVRLNMYPVSTVSADLQTLCIQEWENGDWVNWQWECKCKLGWVALIPWGLQAAAWELSCINTLSNARLQSVKCFPDLLIVTSSHCVYTRAPAGMGEYLSLSGGNCPFLETANVDKRAYVSLYSNKLCSAVAVIADRTACSSTIG